MRKLSQQTSSNAQDVLNKITGGSADETSKETPPVESFNLAELIEQYPYRAALGTAALGGLGYAALGGHEGIANKIQGMVDNPLATASGLGAAGVLSKITYDALKESSLKKTANFPVVKPTPSSTMVYRGDILGNTTGHDISTQAGVDSLLKRMEKERKYDTLLGGLGGALTGAFFGSAKGATEAGIGSLIGAGAGALLGYGGSLLEQNITKDMYGISDELPKPSRTKTSNFRADNAGALVGGIGGALSGLALGAARGGSKGKMIAGLLGGGLLGSGTGYNIGQAVRGKEDDTGWYGSGNPFSWALGTSDKVDSIPQLSVVSPSPTPNPLAHTLSTATGVAKKDEEKELREAADALLAKVKSVDPSSLSPFQYLPFLNDKVKTKSDDEDNFINNYGNYLLGAGALGGLGYGGYKLHQHLTGGQEKKAEYAPFVLDPKKTAIPSYEDTSIGYMAPTIQFTSQYPVVKDFIEPHLDMPRNVDALKLTSAPSSFLGTDQTDEAAKEEFLKDFKKRYRPPTQTEILKYNLGILPGDKFIGAGGTLAGTALGTYLGDRNLRSGVASLLGSIAGGQLGANLGNEFVNYALNNDVDTRTHDLALIGSNLLGQLGGGAAAGYFSREKKANFGENYYNVHNRPGDVGVPQILATAGLYGGALGTGAGLAAGGISGLVAGLTNPSGQKLLAAAQNARRYGIPTALSVGGVGAALLGGAMLYKKMQGNRKNTDTPEQRRESIDFYNQRLKTPGRSKIRNMKDRLMYNILGSGMGKEGEHTPGHEVKYTKEYNHSSALKGKQKTELPDFLQKAIIASKTASKHKSTEHAYTGEYNHNELLEGKQKTELPDFLQKEIIDYRSKLSSPNVVMRKDAFGTRREYNLDNEEGVRDYTAAREKDNMLAKLQLAGISALIGGAGGARHGGLRGALIGALGGGGGGYLLGKGLTGLNNKFDDMYQGIDRDKYKT